MIQIMAALFGSWWTFSLIASTVVMLGMAFAIETFNEHQREVSRWQPAPAPVVGPDIPYDWKRHGL